MPIIVELKENRPGYANLEIKRWKGGAEIEIAVQRNQDQHYFAQGEQWNPEPVWHRVADLADNGEMLQGTIGPWLVDALVQQVGNTQYLLFAKSGDFTDRGVIRFVGNILASSAGGDSFRGEDVRDIIEPEATAQVPQNEPVMAPIVEPEPTAEPEIEEPVIPETPIKPAIFVTKEEKKKSPLIWVLLLLLLISGAAAAWWFISKNNATDVAKPAEPEEAAEISACEVKSGTDELAFIQACLKTNPDTKQLLQVIENAKKANACGVAQRLYANKAQGGNAEIAFAYAKEYDKAFAKGEGCFKPDNETAIYWYETGLAVDPNNAEAKQRLEALKK